MVDRQKAYVVGLTYSLALCGVVYYFVNPIQPTPYMDEEFHAEQTLAYVNGDWRTWNPKITTPPGLYLLTTFIWRLVPFAPTVANFRYLNCFIAGANYIILAELTQDILKSMAILTLPVLTFTSLLFYTDQLSLLAILSSLIAQRSSHNFLAFLSGCFACFVRQTNVVWLAFMVGERAVQRLAISQPRIRKNSFKWIIHLLKSPVDILSALYKAALVDSPHHTATIFLFIICVVFFNNGDIVLGDKSAHKPVLHIPQLFYFFVFCSAHTPLTFIRFLNDNMRIPHGNSLVGFISFTALFIILIHFFTYEHPYLLADNRHYTFYIWSRFFRRIPQLRYTFAPLYLVCASYVCPGLRGGLLSEFLTSMGFLLATSLAIVPAGLIELRYFITPYVAWRLSIPPSLTESKASALELFLNLGINFVTVYIFLYHPFKWISHPFTWQRFMW
ncbi:hypothetical protein Aperf_G00000116400 [Anoplocephala perfoliata]